MRIKVLLILVGLTMLILGSTLNAANSVSPSGGISQPGYYIDDPNMPIDPNEVIDPNDPNDPNIIVPE